MTNTKEENFLIIDENQANQRFDRFCRKYFKSNLEIKLKDIYTWIRKWYIRCNDQKKPENFMLKLWDKISFDKSILLHVWQENNNWLKYDITTSQKVQNFMKKRWYTFPDLIIYEDNHRLVWNKPADIVIHSGNKHMDDVTMNDLLDTYLKIFSPISNRNRYKKNNINIDRETFIPSYGYRLDKDTSGVLISAKDYDTLQYLNEIIRSKANISKYYFAIIYGKIKDKKFDIDLPLFKWYNATYGRAQSFVNFEKWIPCRTTVELLQTIKDNELGYISLLKCQIHTGKMHQIRVHLSHVGYPILGDVMYGNNNINQKLYRIYKINRQLLHSWRYQFVDQEGSELYFQAPIPEDFKKFWFNFTPYL